MIKGVEKTSETGRTKSTRKKGEHDEALKLYLASQGKMPNAELAKRVGVSPASIAKWKANEHWADGLKKAEITVTKTTARRATKAPQPKIRKEEQPQSVALDLEELTCPAHITVLNQKIGQMLSQEYLSAVDLRTLAEAKEAAFGVVSAYVDLIERASEA